MLNWCWRAQIVPEQCPLHMKKQPGWSYVYMLFMSNYDPTISRNWEWSGNVRPFSCSQLTRVGPGVVFCICCAYRGALLHTLRLINSNLNSCCSPISSSQSGYFPLTFGVNMACSPRELLLTGAHYFSLIGSFSVNLEIVVKKKYTEIFVK